MRIGRVLVLSVVTLLSSAQALAGSLVISPKAGTVSVTVYRSRGSQNGDAHELDDLAGYALITETRHIHLPEGDATLRFEGVVGGMIPVSAVVTGLPGGVVQKNRDARLLTPAALVDGSYGRKLHLKRINRKTGIVTEEDADLLAGPKGGIILRTKAGIEALGCAGLPEGLGHDGVPEGLTDKPTFSVETRSKRAVDAVVQLTYLANGFDWAASYVLRVGDEPGSFSLFAWLTLANGNAESLPNAQTQAMAGVVNRVEDPDDVASNQPDPRVRLSCWPMDITSTHPVYSWSRLPFYNGRRNPARIVRIEDEAEGADIIVTAQMRQERLQDVPVAITALAAEMEQLGDLKLYRIPEPVTVAANAQKQVALITERTVKGGLAYGISTPFDYRALQDEFDWKPMLRIVRFRNDKESGLGLPLPAGVISIFDEASGRVIPVSDDADDWDRRPRMDDTAIGQDSFFVAGESTQIMAKLTLEEEKVYSAKTGNENSQHIGYGKYRLTLSNATPLPVSAEIPILVHRRVKLKKPSLHLVKRRGIKTLTILLEPNSKVDFTYSLEPNQ
ncbi:MAG: hypothetical protein IPN84_07535 [Sphingomonadales bacterium]|nr:hypothetical protein [Sphingomonadales bacterium]